MHVDWDQSRDKLAAMYHKYQSMKKPADYCRDHGACQFLRDDIYDNPLNQMNVCLAMLCRKKFEDFFLSDENEIPLNRIMETFVDSQSPSLFMQCPSLFSTLFSFNRYMSLANETV